CFPSYYSLRPLSAMPPAQMRVSKLPPQARIPKGYSANANSLFSPFSLAFPRKCKSQGTPFARGFVKGVDRHRLKFNRLIFARRQMYRSIAKGDEPNTKMND